MEMLACYLVPPAAGQQRAIMESQLCHAESNLCSFFLWFLLYARFYKMELLAPRSTSSFSNWFRTVFGGEQKCNNYSIDTRVLILELQWWYVK